MERYEDLMAYMGDLYVRLQNAERASESKYTVLIEGLRKQLQDKADFIRRLEEDNHRLELELIKIKDGLVNKGTDN